MVNQEHPEGGVPQGDKQAPQAPAETPAFAGAARRRFTKAGAVAVGAVLTLKSQPGMASGPNPCSFATPSAAGSFNINHSRAPATGSCQARSPGYWGKLANKGAWPKQAQNSQLSMWDQPFTDIFPYNGSPYASMTLGEVINMSGGGLQDTARHLIAAYLNAAKGYTLPYLTTDKVKEIWLLNLSAAGFQPAGKVWNTTEISNYIKATWGGLPSPV